MEWNDNQLPPDTSDKLRAELKETHFGEGDVSWEVINESIFPKVLRGMIALHESLYTMNLKAHCETAKILSSDNFNLRVVDDYSSYKADLLMRMTGQAQLESMN